MTPYCNGRVIAVGGKSGKMYNGRAQKMANTPIALFGNVCYHYIIPVEYAYSTKIGIGH